MATALAFLLGVAVGVVFTAIWNWSSGMARYER